MKNKKLWIKARVAILAAIIAISDFYGMPIIANAEDNNIISVQEEGKEASSNGLTDFTSMSGDDKIQIDENAGTVTLENIGGDHFVKYNGQAEKTTDFIFEADINLLDGPSAALIIGTGDKENPFSSWYGANIDTNNESMPFRAFGPGLGDISDGKGLEGVDTGKILHLKIEVSSDGEFTYKFGNKDGILRSASGIIPDWKGGYVGILTFNSKAEFSNISFENREKGLTNFTSKTIGAEFEVNKENHTVTLGKAEGDHFSIYNGLDKKTNDFVLEADIKLIDGPSAALIIGTGDKENPFSSWYGANINTDDNDGQGQFRIFGVNTPFDEKNMPVPENINFAETLHLKLDVKKDGSYTYSFGNNSEEVNSLTGTISNWQGGYIGILTFNSKAEFSNISFTNRQTEIIEDVLPDDTEPGEKIKDFSSKSYGAEFECDNDTGIVTMGSNGGDHFAIYNGLDKKTNDFYLEADVDLLDGPSAALIIGTGNKKQPFRTWYGANIHANNGAQAFRIFGPGIGDISDNKALTDVDPTKTLHLRIDVKADGRFKYSFGNKDHVVRFVQGKIPDWKGGYIGILSFQSKAKFSNICFRNRMQENTETGLESISADDRYKTNLEQMEAMKNGNWKVTEEGLYSNATSNGDSFLYSKTTGKNFVYSTDIIFKGEEGAAALVFRSNNDDSNKNSYAANLDISSKTCKFWRWQDDSDYQLIDAKTIKATEDNKYTLKVVAIDSWISYYINDTLVASTGDYVLQKDNKGQSTCLENGFFGLLNWNGEMVFQNTYFEEISNNISPIIDDITITSSTGEIEEKSQFFQKEPISIQYVKYNAETVDVNVQKRDNQVITILDEQGNVYSDGKNIPVKVGINYLTVISSVTTGNMTAKVTYRVNVHRRQEENIYYNESYRGQYHYSVKDGWGNDPNGLVYYKGTYHFFYQFYDDNKWGPMHWAHATSKDLIHWEEKPMAFYPDANGAMFSGCMIIDAENTSGLFNNIEGGGLVALITEDGNGQRIKLAYSTDEGVTWTKIDKIVADWEDDPLGDGAFRDPKVFRWENKWFMVVAGGPLRIYSSDNLLEWKCESAYPRLHTECPDLYPLKASDGKIKWVLSRGGRFYKIGDFKEVNGNWTFIPDENYPGIEGSEQDGVMNFGEDSYAAMTYYVQDFGTEEEPKLLDRLIESNWMNTWGYCNKVADDVGQKFNGIYNLNLELGIKEVDGNYVLTQTPIEEYKIMRDTEKATILKDVEISENNDLLKDFQGDCYEIVSKFKLAEDTKKIGFKVRTNGEEETVITYDIENETMSIDRTKSGIIIHNNDNNGQENFMRINSQSGVTRNADNTIDLHIYVDRSSVEVFAKDYTIAGANQIFPSENSLGVSVFAEGAVPTADITIYPMNSIWAEEDIEAVNKEELQKLVEEGKKLEESLYTEESFVSWKKVLDTAEDILKDEKASQEKVDTIIKELQTAKAALETKENAEIRIAREELYKALEAAKKIMDKGQQRYTTMTWTKFTNAYNAAKEAPEDADAETLKKLTDSLKTAQTELKEISTGNNNNYGGGVSIGGNSNNTVENNSNENNDKNETTTPEPDKEPNNVETKEDGTIVETVITVDENGIEKKTVTETSLDGSKIETVTETTADGTVLKERVTETASNGTAVATTKTRETNTAGNEVFKVTVEQIGNTGIVTKTTEESTFTIGKTDIIVTTIQDLESKIVNAAVRKQGKISGVNAKITLGSKMMRQIAEAASTDDIDIIVTVIDSNGKELYTIAINKKDMTAGNNLYLYGYSSDTKTYVMIDEKEYSVGNTSSVTIKAKTDNNYILLNKEEMNRVSKAIIKTIKLSSSNKTIKVGKTCKVNLSKKANKESIKKITYTTSNKKLATVSKNGTVKAKASGTVKVKAKVTMKNGKTKVLTLKVKVK